MANLVGTSIARNYLKAVETTNMGTRKLAFFQVELSGVHTNYTDSNSLFAKAVRGLETVIEIYGVGVPSSNQFTVIASDDTAPRPAGHTTGDGARNSILEAAVDAATGGSSSVWDGLLTGWNIANDC